MVARRIVVFSLSVICLSSYVTCQSSDSCSNRGGDGQCVSGGAGTEVCGLPTSHCQTTTTTQDTSLYRHGGTAQAYKENAPVGIEVCPLEKYYNQPSSSANYRLAVWPFRRATYSEGAPRVTLNLQLWACGGDGSGVAKNSASSPSSSCCCQAVAAHHKAVVEVWQARPDGTYSSIRPGVDDGDCRARQLVTGNSNAVTFRTVAPGSFGSLGGLGPSGTDFMPYGPPVLHVMASAEGFEPTLMDLPFHLNPTTLEVDTFGWPDFRGYAWMKHEQPTDGKKAAFEVVSWKALPQEQTVEVTVDIYLQATTERRAGEELYCPSLSGLPYSFFVEPLSTCNPSILDFFPL